MVAEARLAIDYAKINCFIRHLKHKNVLESYYPQYKVPIEYSNCENIVSTFTDQIYADIQTFFQVSSDSSVDVDVNCVIVKLRIDDTLADSAIKQSVFIHSHIMSDIEKTEKINETSKEIRNAVAEAVGTCSPRKNTKKSEAPV